MISASARYGDIIYKRSAPEIKKEKVEEKKTGKEEIGEEKAKEKEAREEEAKEKEAEEKKAEGKKVVEEKTEEEKVKEKEAKEEEIKKRLARRKKTTLPPAVFPHWVHRIRFKCKACHPSIFKMEKGSNPVSMVKIQAGESCGKCHNGRIAFGLEIDICHRCHFKPAAEKTVAQKDGTDPEAEVKAGKIIYEKWCAACHGIKGLGDGPAAPALDPKPRNFFDGAFKIRTTPSGELPLHSDVVKIIADGMPGSSMPAWKGLITTREASQSTVYIWTLMEDWLQEEEPPEPVEIGKPPPATKESIAKGKKLFTRMKCWECHGKEGKGDGPSAKKAKDDWGYPIKPANLTEQWNFRGGNAVTDIYRTVTVSLNGTPMPAFLDVLSDEDRWHLANYVKTLARDKQPALKTFWEWVKNQK